MGFSPAMGRMDLWEVICFKPRTDIHKNSFCGPQKVLFLPNTMSSTIHKCVVFIGLCTLTLVNLGRTTHPSGHDLNLIRGRQNAADKKSSNCHLEYTTDVWTGCAQLLEQFNVSLAYFRYANPEITANCASFVPGQTYCIHRGGSLSLL